MKAYLITSSEHWANKTSVFLFHEGSYYGCTNYPFLRNFPKKIEYWFTAPCADSDRFFKVEEVFFNENDFDEIKKLQNCIDANDAVIEKKSFAPIQKKWKVKRGKNYLQWKSEKEAQQKEIEEHYNRNRPFAAASIEAKERLIYLLLFLNKKTKQNEIQQ